SVECTWCIDEDGRDMSFRSQIAQPFESGSHHAAAAEPFVFKYPFIRNGVAVLASELHQCGCLARNRVFFFLFVRGYPCVDRRALHRRLHSAQNRELHALDPEPESRRLAAVWWRANDQTRSRDGPYDPFSGGCHPCLRVAFKKVLTARATISPSVSPLTAE